MVSIARLSIPILMVVLILLLGGCAQLPWATERPHGVMVMHSPGCHCRFRFPANWYFSPGNNDPSQPRLGLHSYDDRSADHVPFPKHYATIGVDWQNDDTGALYQAMVARPDPSMRVQHLTVSGFPAVSYAHWTAPPSQGGVYEQHVYFFVPVSYFLPDPTGLSSPRDYNLWLMTSDPPNRDVSGGHRVFAGLLRSFVIVPRNAVP